MSELMPGREVPTVNVKRPSDMSLAVSLIALNEENDALAARVRELEAENKRLREEFEEQRRQAQEQRSEMPAMREFWRGREGAFVDALAALAPEEPKP